MDIDMCATFCNVLPGNNDAVILNCLIKQESHRVYN